MFNKIRRSLSYRLDKDYWQKEKFEEGYRTFIETGNTPVDSTLAMINLYCKTNGKFNEQVNRKISAANPPVRQHGDLSGAIGVFNQKQFAKVNDTLNTDGYVFFEKKLSKQKIESLVEYALKTPAVTPSGNNTKVVYQPDKPISEIYRFDIVDLINNHEIQELAIDPAIVNIARNYLGCEPIFDFPAMWWSTAFLKEASGEAAQLYHFDMDRIKWLKIFIYLNDVTDENGPHCYIRGSHVPGTKPSEILSRGYARIPDADLEKYYKREDFKKVQGIAGTIFAGDTKCFHKGSALRKGHRLVLELEYTSSMFGANYSRLDVHNPSPAFREYCSKNTTFSSNLHFTNNNK